MAENDNQINHDPNGESSTESVGAEVHLVQAATDLPKSLAKALITQVAHVANLKAAFKVVVTTNVP